MESLPSERDETMSAVDDEEERKTTESLVVSAKEFLHKLKLFEALTKTIDHMVSLGTTQKAEDFFLILDSSLFPLIAKNMELN